eukprot:s2258_g20.t2
MRQEHQLHCLESGKLDMLQSGRARAVYVLTVFSVVLEIVGVPPGHLRGPGDSWILPKHSFERTLPWHDDDETWLLSAASMPMQDFRQTLPIHAFLWNKKVIQSTDFEDGSLAFWMGTEDCTKSFNEKALVEKVLRDRNMDWRVGLKELGYSENGHRPDFKGIAVIFLPFDRDRKLRQTVAAVFSDGTRPIPTPLEDVLKEAEAAQAELTSPSCNFSRTPGQRLLCMQSSLPVAPDRSQTGCVKVNGGICQLGKSSRPKSYWSQAEVRVHADGSIVVSKRQGMAHLAGAVWSWAPDGQEVKGTFVLQPDNTLSWKGHPNSGRWNTCWQGGKLNITLFEANFVLRLEGNRAVQELPDFPVRAIAYLGGQEVEDEPWQKLASFPAKTLAVPVPNMFYGFTGYSGTKFGMEVNLNYLGTFNHDPHVVGEEWRSSGLSGSPTLRRVEDGFSIAQSQQWKAALADEARFIDRVSQREAIERLTKLLADHVVLGSAVSQGSAMEEAV